MFGKMVFYQVTWKHFVNGSVILEVTGLLDSSSEKLAGLVHESTFPNIRYRYLETNKYNASLTFTGIRING